MKPMGARVEPFFGEGLRSNARRVVIPKQLIRQRDRYHWTIDSRLIFSKYRNNLCQIVR